MDVDETGPPKERTKSQKRRNDLQKASVIFGRQGQKVSGAGAEPPKKKPDSGCFACFKAIITCDFDGCFGALMPPPPASMTVMEYEERQTLQAIPARCKAWDALSEVQKTSLGGIDIITSSAPKEGVPGWVNQDRYFACQMPIGPNGGIPALLLGVFDGHGRYGHEAADICADRLPRHLAAQESDPLSNPKEALTAAVRVTDQDLYKALGPDVEYSGTTGLVILFDIEKRLLHCANVGDSRAVLGRGVPDAKVPQWEAVALTKDCKPSIPEERERIEMCGGTVSAYMDNGSPSGPERVWEDPSLRAPGLAVSRTMGDGCARAVGVIPDPVMTTHALTKDDYLILLATDGLWDDISNDKAVGIIVKFSKNPAIGVKAMIESVRRENCGELSDDTTVVLVKFGA